MADGPGGTPRFVCALSSPGSNRAMFGLSVREITHSEVHTNIELSAGPDGVFVLLFVCTAKLLGVCLWCEGTS